MSTSLASTTFESDSRAPRAKKPRHKQRVTDDHTYTADEGFLMLGVTPELDAALRSAGIVEPFPIQAATVPDALAGRDILGKGQTGSGKTYAFAIPVLQRLAANRVRRQAGRPRAVILAPTRELATQIDASMRPLAKALGLRTITIFGGVPYGGQIKALESGVDIVIACPGRLADHVERGNANLDSVEITVLDEADHMADLGFLPVVQKLLDVTPKNGQRLLFSATLDRAVGVLVKRYLNSPVTHSVEPEHADTVAMTHHVLHIGHDARVPVLVDLSSVQDRTLVFTRTKHGAKLLAKKLTAAGVPSVELHGNLSQGARTRNLKAFTDGKASTLVATDVAARGIHVDDIRLVIHADPPAEHKAFLHRSGRTARAGASGTVVTLMTDAQQRDVRDLTRKAGIHPTFTRVSAGDPLLAEISPGDRVHVKPSSLPIVSDEGPRQPRRSRGPRRNGDQGGRPRGQGSSTREGAARGSAPRNGSARNGSARNGSARAGTTRGAAGFSAGAKKARSRTR